MYVDIKRGDGCGLVDKIGFGRAASGVPLSLDFGNIIIISPFWILRRSVVTKEESEAQKKEAQNEEEAEQLTHLGLLP